MKYFDDRWANKNLRQIRLLKGATKFIPKNIDSKIKIVSLYL